MKIIHICDLSYKQGHGANGIITVVEELSQAQRKIGNEVIILSITENKKIEDLPFHYICCSINELKKQINNFCPDIVIFHSLYKIKYWLFGKILNKYQVPYLIEFHGGATRNNFNKGKFKKIIANLLFFNKFISSANGVIYLNNQEEKTSVFVKLNPRSLIIPNGISKTNTHKKYCPKRRVEIVFLGRIDWHHKGLDYLLESIRILNKEKLLDSFHISFYGPLDNPGQFLECLKELDNVISYGGLVIGEEKNTVLNNADIYILTSRYEGMPMTVLEALNNGCPCIITPQTNMQSIIEKNHCGWITTLDSKAIAQTIKKAITQYKLTPQEWIIKAYKSVDGYDWNDIAKYSIEQYGLIIK